MPVHILKLPNVDSYVKLSNIEGFRIATPRPQDTGFTVFIDINSTRGYRCEYVKFKTRKTAQNFCATLSKKIERVLSDA